MLRYEHEYDDSTSIGVLFLRVSKYPYPPEKVVSLVLPYRTKIRRTKYFTGQNFRHRAEISTILSNFCLTFVSKY